MDAPVNKMTPLAQAMSDAERENVVMRKGFLYDVLIAAAKETAEGAMAPAKLAGVVRYCEEELKDQAEAHARQWGLR